MREETFPPARFDFFPYGGIHRPVYIFTTPEHFINDITVKTFFLSQRKGKVSISVEVNSDKNFHLHFTLEDEGKGSVINGKFTEDFNTSFEIDNCRFWSIEDPHLYNLKIRLMDNQDTIDEYSLRIGVREVKIKGFKLLINNKPVFLRGFGKHEDFPVTGKALNLPLYN